MLIKPEINMHIHQRMPVEEGQSPGSQPRRIVARSEGLLL